MYVNSPSRISRLAEIDPRITWVLQSVRKGSLSYHGHYAASPNLVEFSKDLGYPASWGDFRIIPAYGMNSTPIWRKLGVKGRDGVGGIPCELVHGDNGSGNSCWQNISIRGRKAWLAALLIYLPVLSFSSRWKPAKDMPTLDIPPSIHGQTTERLGFSQEVGTNTPRNYTQRDIPFNLRSVDVAGCVFNKNNLSRSAIPMDLP